MSETSYIEVYDGAGNMVSSVPVAVPPWATDELNLREEVKKLLQKPYSDWTATDAKRAVYILFVFLFKYRDV